MFETSPLYVSSLGGRRVADRHPRPELLRCLADLEVGRAYRNDDEPDDNRFTLVGSFQAPTGRRSPTQDRSGTMTRTEAYLRRALRHHRPLGATRRRRRAAPQRRERGAGKRRDLHARGGAP